MCQHYKIKKTQWSYLNLIETSTALVMNTDLLHGEKNYTLKFLGSAFDSYLNPSQPYYHSVSYLTLVLLEQTLEQLLENRTEERKSVKTLHEYMPLLCAWLTTEFFYTKDGLLLKIKKTMETIPKYCWRQIKGKKEFPLIKQQIIVNEMTFTG